MQQPPLGAGPRQRSAFAAAFLSLLFPGLGHAYAGAGTRALGFGAVPVLLLALTAGIAASSGLTVFGAEIAANLPLILILNVVILGYRLVAAVDAWRVAIFLNAAEVSSGSRFGIARTRPGPASVAGLLAVCLVMAGGHGVVGYYGSTIQDTLNCVFNADVDCADNGSASPGPTGSGQPTDTPAPGETSAPPIGSPVPSAQIPSWNGKDRLNILLIGADQRPSQGTFNTDTLIVVSIDPVSKQVAMFSLPRDTVDIPIPPGPARSVFGSVYAGKINSLWMNARNRSDAFPGNTNSRGYNALKSVLGYAYGLNIQFYIEVNFDGFRQIVDTLGGVTVNVQIPVVDDHYPGDDGTDLRVYIPSGVQHMTGSQALVYARSRHLSAGGDFDRAQRQQRVILSIRQQLDPASVLANMTGLLGAMKQSFKTDIPQAALPELVQLSSQIDTSKIRSFVFAPPRYASNAVDQRGDIVEPNIARIRQAVATAFQLNPQLEAEREQIANEDGVVWVVNGSGKLGQANTISAYLEYLGLTASAQTQRPPGKVAQTQIKVYNGAESSLPGTVSLLESVFKVQAQLVTDPSVIADIIVTTGTGTPNLTAPPGP